MNHETFWPIIIVSSEYRQVPLLLSSTAAQLLKVYVTNLDFKPNIFFKIWYFYQK